MPERRDRAEYFRAYREANKDAIQERQRAYYEANKDAIQERQRAYASRGLTRAERVAEIQRKYSGEGGIV